MIVGIIGAMEIETEKFKSRMSVKTVENYAGMTYHRGALNEVEIVVVTCGIGKVNAAICAQILINIYKVNAVINTGVAGAINEDLKIGDIVISTDCVEHDIDITDFGHDFGVIPSQETSYYVADEKLILAALEASKRQIKSHNVVKGRIVSGDQFVSKLSQKEFIESHFLAFATEMEGAAIAHACFLNKVPFVIIRAMSDEANGAAPNSFEEFAKESADNSHGIVVDMLEHINL